MTDDLSFSADFPRGDEAQWRALVDKALKGASFDTLTTRTEHGVAVKPLYRAPDWDGAHDASGFPGLPPFTRGVRALNDAYLPWDIRQVVAHPDPAAAAAEVMEALNGGVSSVELRIDAAGEQGVVARSAADLSKIIADARLDLATVALEAAGASSAHGVELAALLATAVGERAAGAMIAFNVDPIGVLARTGGLPGSVDAELAEAAAFARDARVQFPAAKLLRADGRAVHEAGGTEVQELAFLAASGAEYMRALMSAGFSADAAARAILFCISIGPDYQVEIAKLRAARRVLGRIAGAFGVKTGAVTLQAVTSRRMLSRRDPWVNMLRNTAACFAAGVGGADIVTVRPFTDAIGLPGKLARRLARNTQVIAQEESSLGKVTDAPGGSWALERLGEDLAAAAWSLFQGLEREGGALRALTNGAFQVGVADARAKRMKAIARRKEWVTGVNDFPLLTEEIPPTETVDLPMIVRGAAEASGHALTDRNWAALCAAAASRATLADLAKTGEAGAEAEPFWPIRLSEPFERLRDLADQRAAAGKPPKVFLAALGPVAEHGARLTYARNFFATGGIDAVTATGGAADIAAAFKTAGCGLACVCGSDKRYAADAVLIALALRTAGAGRIYLAGNPGAQEAAYRDAGVAEFIHAGVDVLASLELAHAELGLG